MSHRRRNSRLLRAVEMIQWRLKDLVVYGSEGNESSGGGDDGAEDGAADDAGSVSGACRGAG